MNKKKKVPSPADFARAKAAMREDDRGLSEVCERILSRFGNKNLHEFYLLYSSNANSFGAYTFYETAAQVDKFSKNGQSEEIKNAVYEELDSVGRGNREEITVNFYFDNHEDVVRNFEGNYHSRLYS